MSEQQGDTSSLGSTSPYWCDVCGKDLQSQPALAEHVKGRKHLKKLFDLDPTDNSMKKRPISFSSSSRPPSIIDEAELFQNLKAGKYKNIVVLTGAGISTSAGIPDYRSTGGGFFERMLQQYSQRFPEVNGSPELLFSRAFANRYPTVWRDELLPLKQSFFRDIQPTKAHRFCAYLHEKGWLRRIYTQNIDGLHVHPTLGIPEEKVVECHGSIRNPSTLVLYGDPLSPRFDQRVRQDFDLNLHGTSQAVDLVLVMGTSLQVAPFCGLPNMTPSGATRVLVNRYLNDCFQNSFTASKRSEDHGYSMVTQMTIGGRKNVKLQPTWLERKSNKKWRQLLVETDCDDFVQRYFDCTAQSMTTATTTSSATTVADSQPAGSCGGNHNSIGVISSKVRIKKI